MYAREMNSFFSRLTLGSKMSSEDGYHEHYLSAVSAMSDLIVYAPKHVLFECQRYAMLVFEYSEAKGSERRLRGYPVTTRRKSKEIYPLVKIARRSAMHALRADLEQSDSRGSAGALDSFWSSRRKKARRAVKVVTNRIKVLIF